MRKCLRQQLRRRKLKQPKKAYGVGPAMVAIRALAKEQAKVEAPKRRSWW